MKATLVFRTDDHATVRLTPSWLARLLGAKESLCELEWYVEGKGANRRCGWLSVGSRRWIDEIDHGRLVESALDFAPIVDPPRAIARDAAPRVYSSSGCRFDPCAGDDCGHDREGWHCADCGDDVGEPRVYARGGHVTDRRGMVRVSRMRDPARIDRICELLRQAWHTSPDLRLGQLVYNLIGRGRVDVFQIEDDVTERKLRELIGDHDARVDTCGGGR